MQAPELPEDIEPEITPDRSVYRFALIMGIIVLILLFLSIFMEDIRRFFRPADTPITIVQEDSISLLTETAAMNEEEVRSSLTKFIEAFFVDQKKGYFDPPSYFDPITDTYYNYHNLTHQRLKQVHAARMADYKELELSWQVHTLSFERRNDSIYANFWTRQNYFKPSKNARESAEVLLEMVINPEGKISVLKEREVRNLVSSPIAANPVESTAQGSSTKAQTVEQATPEPPENQVYNSALLDTPPEFAGGNRKLSQFLRKNMKYPNRAKEQGVQGKVFVSFVVESNGSLSNLKIIRGIGSGCDEEALRVMRSSPSWKPGILDGKPVRSSFVLPIVFQLAGE
ncbi:MAG: hypothetical protein RI924_176 [Bacteroidota bacterium]|jgi:TonB family protein